MCKVDLVLDQDRDNPGWCMQSVSVFARCCVEKEEKEEDFDSGTL